MNPLIKTMKESPAAARVAPFLIFLLLTFAQDSLGEAGRYWIYFGKTLVGLWFIWVMRPIVREMRWAASWEAVAVGILVCVLWVGLGDIAMKKVDPATAWNPFRQFGDGTLLAWFFVAVRTLGSALVVPPLEEAFYRSFLYRFIANPDFEKLPLNFFSWVPFLVSALIFGFAHNEWLAGILCAMGYQWLVIRKGRLGDAMCAHAITNFLLGVWVVWKGDWRFW
jgi:CAAX prenyl protease-like protein